jgi:hypothetical protein
VLGHGRFGRAKEPFLRQFLRLCHGIPSHDTFSRVFRLPSNRGVVVIAEIVRGDLVGAGDVLRIVQRREIARPDLSRP